jgi:dihydropteroate synthase
MGILNVTPDSFSDGGLFFGEEAAIVRGFEMVAEGADLVDVGGESTRPGAEPVALDEELRRVLPVVRELAKRKVAVSVDTSKSEVAWEAVRAGARVVNDVRGLRDRAMVEALAQVDCSVCVMHMLGEPRTMQASPVYGDVVEDVRTCLLGQASLAEDAGIAKERIWIDPGIGFGKTLEHNLALLRGLGRLVGTGYPVLVGVSRKSFIGRILGTAKSPAPVEERLDGTLAAQVLAQAAGARVLRVHDVRPAVRAAKVAGAIIGWT